MAGALQAETAASQGDPSLSELDRFQAEAPYSYELLYAPRIGTSTEGGIGEVLRVSRETRISLAGGLPEILHDVAGVIDECDREARQEWSDKAVFQYEGTAGFPPLRENAVTYLRDRLQVAVSSPSEILATEGSQDGLNLIGLALLRRGDRVGITVPSYVGMFQAFSPYIDKDGYVVIASDEFGMIPESLQEILETHRLKMIYEVDTFGNPSGKTLSIKRREQIADIMLRHNWEARKRGESITLWVADDPYSRLRYYGEHLPSLQLYMPLDSLELTTFSKLLVPAIRTGLVVGPVPIIKTLTRVKEGVNLCGSNRNQAVVAKYLEGTRVEDHLKIAISTYKPRLDAMLQALEMYFPASWKWTTPEGGMFVWAEGPKGTDTASIFQEAQKEGVAFVPGHHFYPSGGEHGMRLNFSFKQEADIREAIAIIGHVIQKMSPHSTEETVVYEQ